MTSATVQPTSTLRVLRINDSHENEIGANDDEANINTFLDTEDLQAPVASGETIFWELECATSGSEDLNLALIVRTPPHPNGGFQILWSASGIFLGQNYGADSYNSPVGVIRSQEPGTLLGYGTFTVRGILSNSQTPGLLKFQWGIAEPGLLVAVVVGFTGGDHTFYRLEDGEWVAGAEVKLLGNQPTTNDRWRPAGNLPLIVLTNHRSPTDAYMKTEDRGDTFEANNPIFLPEDIMAISNNVEEIFGPDCTGLMYATNHTENPESLWSSEDGFEAATLVKRFGIGAEHLIPIDRGIAMHPTDYNKIAVLQEDHDGTNFLGDILLYVTDDRGVTWTRNIVKAEYGGNSYIAQASVVWTASGRLTVFLVSYDLDTLTTHYSDDDGVTWTQAIQRTNLDTNNDPTSAAFHVMPRNLYDKMLCCFSYLDSSAAGHSELWRTRDGITWSTIDLPLAWPVRISSAAYDPDRDLLWAAFTEQDGAFYAGRGLYTLVNPLTATAADWVEVESPNHEGSDVDRIALDSMTWILPRTP